MPKWVYVRDPNNYYKYSENAKKNTKIRWWWYGAIHKRITKYYGKANRCEAVDCNWKSKRFHRAKVQWKEYTHNRDNFIMLCSICHKNYDMMPEIWKKISNAKKGKKLSESHSKNISISMKPTKEEITKQQLREMSLDWLFLDKETRILKEINKQANIVNSYMDKSILINAQIRLMELKEKSKQHKNKADIFITMINHMLWLR